MKRKTTRELLEESFQELAESRRKASPDELAKGWFGNLTEKKGRIYTGKSSTEHDAFEI